jgi:DNA-binding response OmpR family regulator
MRCPPDLVLIDLGLPDLSGDIVALKLRHMPKTMNIPFLVYVKEDLRRNYVILDHLKEKIGTEVILESNDPYVLLKRAECLLKGKEGEKDGA